MKKLTFSFRDASYFASSNGFYSPDLTGAVNALVVLAGGRPKSRNRASEVPNSFVHDYFAQYPERLSIEITEETRQTLYCEKATKKGSLPEQSGCCGFDETFSAARYGSAFTEAIKELGGGSFRNGVMSISFATQTRIKELMTEKTRMVKEMFGDSKDKTDEQKAAKLAYQEKLQDSFVKVKAKEWFDSQYGEMFKKVLDDPRTNKGKPPTTYSYYSENVKYFTGLIHVEDGIPVASPRPSVKAPENAVTYSGTITVAADREFYHRFTDAYRKAGVVATLGDGGLIQLTELPDSIEEAVDL